MSVFPSLDYLQIESRYPKAVKKIQEWVFEQEEFKKVTQDFVDPNNPDESKRQFVGMMIQMDPRKLYDIFDALGIYISISKELGIEKWQYTIGEESGLHYAANRIQAEQTSFHDAFEELEKTL